MTKYHSNEIEGSTDLDRCRIPNMVQYEGNEELEKRCSLVCRWYKEKGVYGKRSIITRVRMDVYSESKQAADLKFKCARGRECVKFRTMAVHVRGLAVIGLVLMLVATIQAAPTRSRPGRSTHIEKNTRSYLEQFGYLKKGQPEVGNLLMGDVSHSYEDEFRIAIKTLQEFGGIPVTGEIDHETKELMKKKRCGRPDREPENYENGGRKKRFAVQGEKWKHTNLTWSLSQSRRPSQLDPHGTRSVLARALDVWEQASRLTFTEVNSDDADIVVSFAKRFHDDAYPFDGRGSILAHAFFPGTGRGGDAHFDDEELWLLQPKNDDEEGTSLFAVAAHEFGHSLGLSHSSVKGALMFPWYQGIQPNFVLPEDDRNGIQQMYGKFQTPTTTSTTTTTTTTTTTRRPYIYHHHPERHPNHRPYTPQYPRPPSRYPYYPERPNYPDRSHPTYPDRPHYPDRRHNNTEEHPRRTNHNHYPRTETTTHATTYRPRYPHVRPEYPSHPRPNYPTDPAQDHPKKKPYYPVKTTTVKPPPSDKPDTCDTSYDAVSLIRGELFIFKNRYHWRIGANGRYPGYPIEISRMWSVLPSNLTHVDAVYERPDRKIAIFVGKELYLFDSQYLMPGYPKKLVQLGLPESLEKLDAAMVWGHNGKTYFYSGSMYWKFDEDIGRVELDYPRDMAMWKGVGYNIDSVFQWKDGKTYFFKGKGFWKFNDLQMRVEHDRQYPSAEFWMACPTERAGRRAPFRALPSPGSTLRSPSSAPLHTVNIYTCVFALVLILSNYLKYL
ncbi:matrix metalloproteinase-2-like [Zerene cesonia]|uniref:matrix metalloproteinase-2-like n=1 Tax=Zerene cesonia TaxID=33412 RepID=UPI0018E5051A|nr:matrix metalloproteinase-2-like [Zerene cesonia]